MKSKVLIILSLLLLLWGIAPGSVESSPLAGIAVNEVSSETQELEQPLKTYLLTLLPGVARQVVQINPPATRLVVTSRSGDTAVRCGDGERSYSCVPGKRLEILADSAAPVDQFWGENTHEIEVRLRIEVYEEFSGEADLNRGESDQIVTGDST